MTTPDLTNLQLVAWCPECKIWCPADEIGRTCPMDGHDTYSGFRKLIKRRGYVCPGDMVLLTKGAYLEHMEECSGIECGV